MFSCYPHILKTSLQLQHKEEKDYQSWNTEDLKINLVYSQPSSAPESYSKTNESQKLLI